jgi:hypothetical protein
MSIEDLLQEIRRVEMLAAIPTQSLPTIVIEFARGRTVDLSALGDFVTTVSAERLLAPVDMTPYGETEGYHGVVASFSTADPPALIRLIRNDIAARAKEAGAALTE